MTEPLALIYPGLFVDDATSQAREAERERARKERLRIFRAEHPPNNNGGKFRPFPGTSLR